jgi:hypothetical protein
MPDEPKTPEPNLADELRELGTQLTNAIRAARESKQAKDLEQQIASALRDAEAQIKQAVESARASDEWKSAHAQIKETAQKVKDSSAGEDIQRGIAKALRALNAEIGKAVEKLETPEDHPPQ